MTNATTNLEQAQREARAIERIAEEQKSEATNLYTGLKTRCKDLDKAGRKHQQIGVEVAADMYQFILNGHHKLLGFSIEQLAKDFLKSKNAHISKYLQQVIL